MDTKPIANSASTTRPEYPAHAAPKAPPASVKLTSDTVTLRSRQPTAAATAGKVDRDGDNH